jgi:hypothetical protein
MITFDPALGQYIRAAAQHAADILDVPLTTIHWTVQEECGYSATHANR